MKIVLILKTVEFLVAYIMTCIVTPAIILVIEFYV